MFLARVSSLDHAPRESSAKVTSCQRFALCLDRYSLFLYNSLDFLFGCMCLYFGVFMYEKLGKETFTHVDVAWLGWLSLTSGVLLLLSSVTGLCGLSSKGYRWCMAPSACLAVVIAAMSLLVAVLIFTLQSNVIRYVEDEQEDLGLSNSQVSTFETFYMILGYGFVGFFVLEILRYRASKHFRKNIYRSDGEFEALLDEGDAATSDRMEAEDAARSDKYNNLREHYRNKYSGVPRDSSASAGSF